jgi:hypothetical protein
VLLVPVNAVVLVFAVTQQFDDLAASRWLAMHSARLDPVADMGGVSLLWCHSGVIQSFGCGFGIGVWRRVSCGDLLSRWLRSGAHRTGSSSTGMLLCASVCDTTRAWP